jgi:hypothetical protein
MVPETPVPPVPEGAGGALATIGGGSGGGWFDDDGGDWGGWGGGDDGDDGAWWPHHHGRGVRIVAACVAGALILATSGTWLTVAVEGSGPTFDASITSVQPAAGGPTARGESGGAELVTFAEANGWSRSVVPDCSVVIVRNGRIVGSATVGPGPSVPARATVSRSVVVSVPNLPPAGTQDSASVACLISSWGS